MEPQEQVQNFIHTCALMVDILKEGRSHTGMEMQLLETHLRQVVAELEMKKLRDRQTRTKK